VRESATDPGLSILLHSLGLDARSSEYKCADNHKWWGEYGGSVHEKAIKWRRARQKFD